MKESHKMMFTRGHLSLTLALCTVLLGCQTNKQARIRQVPNDSNYDCDAFDVDDLLIFDEGDLVVSGFAIPLPVSLPAQTAIFKASRMGISIARLVVDGNQIEAEETSVDYYAQPEYYDEFRTVYGRTFVYQLLLGKHNIVFAEETDYGIETETTEGEVEFFRISPSWKVVELTYQLRLPTGLAEKTFEARVER